MREKKIFKIIVCLLAIFILSGGVLVATMGLQNAGLMSFRSAEAFLRFLGVLFSSSGFVLIAFVVWAIATKSIEIDELGLFSGKDKE